jgi:D-alanyl-D-alanine carboxypeptidase
MSVYDLAIVARNALAVPQIAEPAKALSYELTDPSGIAREFENHNEGFLRTYPGATGLKTGHTDRAGRTLVTSATRDGRSLIGVVIKTWDDTGWSGSLLDQGFTMPADTKGTGERIPPVRAVTADQRRAALVGLPSALGTAALDGSTLPVATPPSTARPVPTTTRDTRARVAAGSDGGQLAAATTPADSTGSGFGLGSIFSWRVLLVVVLVFLLTLFLLRRRAVRRQRARRLERMKRMEEIKRRRMIDLVEPGDPVGHVRVVPPRTGRRAI